MKRPLRTLVVRLLIGSLGFALVACSAPAPAPTKPAAASAALALDNAFGPNGFRVLPLNPSTHDRFMAMAAGADGKVYAAGYVIEGGDQMMAVARVDATGNLDKSFGKDGVAAVNAAPGGKAAELARSVVVQSTGKIVIAGPLEHDVAATGDAARDTDVAAIRFDDTGKLDASFGTGGIAKIDLGAGKVTTGTTFVGDNSWGMANLAGDKLVIFGSKLADGAGRADNDYVVFGLTNTGALDTSFGTGGTVALDFDKGTDNPRTVLVQPDGKIVATGYSTGADGVVQPVLIRLTATGALDTTFGKGGIASAKVLPGVAESYAISLQGENYISTGYGRGASTAEKVDLIVERWKPDGTLDTTFGKDGLVRIDIAKDDDRGRNLIVLPDQRILVLGSGKKNALNVDAMLVLLSKDGAPVTTFGEGGNLITDLGGTADAWYGVALSADKKHVWIAGYKGTEGSGNDDAVVARLAL